MIVVTAGASLFICQSHRRQAMGLWSYSELEAVVETNGRSYR
jgi:hypothetical protein